MPDRAAAPVAPRLGKGEALIVISLASLGLWAATVAVICSLAPAVLR
jgi:hypothetical protein